MRSSAAESSEKGAAPNKRNENRFDNTGRLYAIFAVIIRCVPSSPINRFSRYKSVLRATVIRHCVVDMCTDRTRPDGDRRGSLDTTNWERAQWFSRQFNESRTRNSSLDAMNCCTADRREGGQYFS